jgi:hypothetical protein
MRLHGTQSSETRPLEAGLSYGAQVKKRKSFTANQDSFLPPKRNQDSDTKSPLIVRS